MKATVDHLFESMEDPLIIVTLPCDFQVKFFVAGLSDEEYIRRAELIKIYQTGKEAEEI